MIAEAPLLPFRLDPTATGLELAHRWINQGPVMGLNGRLRVQPVMASPGHIRFVCRIDEGHGNFSGLVHGGVTAALIDIAGGGAAMTLLQQGETLLTADLSMRFLNPAPLDGGDLVADGRVTYQDGRRTLVEVQVTCGQIAMAHGSVSISVRRPKAG